MEEKNIVALDLGTSTIALTVAKVNGDDVQIVYYKEMPSAGIRYSGIFNPVNASDPVSRIIKDAEEALDIKITEVVVGKPKYAVRQESNSGKVIDRGEDTDITAEDIAALKQSAEDSYPLEDETKEAIYGAVAQSFSDGENFQIIENDIIGMASDVLEGHFKIFIGKSKDLKNIDTTMRKSGISARKKYFTADTTAKAVLSEAEMENGVALIDFGGGSTSVTIYHGSILRHYASIPFGGKNITNDIKTECQISERLAENIKLAYGACMPEKLQSLSEKVIHIISNNAEPDKQVTVKYLSEIITARVEEIMMAMLYEIEQSGFADLLRSGIVVTGGCAQIANLGNFIYELSGYRVRTGYPQGRISAIGCDGIKDTTAAASIGLILAAKEDVLNCEIIEEEIEEEEIEEPAPAAKTVAEAPAKEVAPEDTEAPVAPRSQPRDGEIFADDEIEKVAPKPKKERKGNKRSIFDVIWRGVEKVKEETGTLLDDLSKEEV
ncbi:MAG: cell division protein FtsA [Bacteroidales bacterium]|nr:cell division protein FtsA [Bacteroidales bacterium]